jgi:predicted nucleic acid-binding protein
MTKTSEKVFVDSNVLIYAIDASAGLHSCAVAALSSIDAAGQELWISPQVVRETLRVLLRICELGMGLDYLQVVNVASRHFENLSMAEENRSVSEELRRLMSSLRPASRLVHDANIVATMRVHGIRRLLTHNTDDFQAFAHLVDIAPLVPRAS